MPRPKGSKNKKKAVPTAVIAQQLADREQEKAKLEAEQQSVLDTIAQQQQRLKAVKKQLRALDKDILGLQEKAEEAAAIEKAMQDREMLDQVLTELSSVLPADVIFDTLRSLQSRTGDTSY